MEKLTAHSFKSELARFGSGESFLIAYSGGMDSHVLLHLCATCRSIDPDLEFSAVHVNHDLHTDSSRWAEHCSDVCRSLNLPFKRLNVNAFPVKGKSPEETAREARYNALQPLVGQATVLLTAHHLDDQTETILLQLLRGSGTAGLSGMAQVGSFSNGSLFRPLLMYPRAALSAYAELNRLDWIEDPSNTNISYDRNYLRHKVIPVLQRRWPAASKTIARSGRHCAETQSILESISDEWLDQVDVTAQTQLPLTSLRSLSLARQRLMLRRWIHRCGYRYPTELSLNRIINEILTAAPDKNPKVTWPKAEVRRYRSTLYLMPALAKFDSSLVFDWDGEEALSLTPDVGQIQACLEPGAGIAQSAWSPGKIQIQFYQGGETCAQPGRAGRHRLKKLFQEYAVPPWVRERIPLVYIDGELAAVGDLWVCSPYYRNADTNTIKIRWFGHQLMGVVQENSNRLCL